MVDDVALFIKRTLDHFGGPKELRLPGVTILPDGVALLTVGVASLLTLMFSVVLEPADFLLFLPAVKLSAWYGGLQPGFLATFFSSVVLGFLLLPTRLAPAHNLTNTFRLTVFIQAHGARIWVDS